MQRGKLQTDCRLVEPVGTACCVVFSVPVARYKNENNRCFPVCVLGGNVYFVDYSQDSENYRVLFQPTSKMIESIKRFNPRNVFVMED